MAEEAGLDLGFQNHLGGQLSIGRAAQFQPKLQRSAGRASGLPPDVEPEARAAFRMLPKNRLICVALKEAGGKRVLAIEI